MDRLKNYILVFCAIFSSSLCGMGGGSSTSQANTSASLHFADYLAKKLESLSTKKQSIAENISGERQKLKDLWEKLLTRPDGPGEKEMQEQQDVVKGKIEDLQYVHNELIALNEAIQLIDNSSLRNNMQNRSEQLANEIEQEEKQISRKRMASEASEIDELRKKIEEEKPRQLSQSAGQIENIQERELLGEALEPKPGMKITFCPRVKVIEIDRYISKEEAQEMDDMIAAHKRTKKRFKLTSKEYARWEMD